MKKLYDIRDIMSVLQLNYHILIIGEILEKKDTIACSSKVQQQQCSSYY